MSNMDFLGPVQPIDPEAILRLFRFHVSGVEVTQSIQYYHSSQHLTDPADRGADDSVTIVANKPAWVRVYVRSGFHHGPIPGVTGHSRWNDGSSVSSTWAWPRRPRSRRRR